MKFGRLVSWLRQLGEWIAGAAIFLGPWGVFVISLADSAFIPMPQGVDALLLAQAIASPDVAYLSAGLGVIGSLLGSAVLYSLARRAGHSMLRRSLSSDGIERLSDLVGRWGAALVIPVTMIPLPLPMKPVVLAAGAVQMPLVTFCLAILLARLVRYGGIVFLGLRYGERGLELALANIPAAVLACAVLAALFVLLHRFANLWLNRAD